MNINFKNDCQSDGSFQRQCSSYENDKNDKPINLQLIIHEIQKLCEESISAFYVDDFDTVNDKLSNISNIFDSYIDFIQFENEEISILNILHSFEFDDFIFKLCSSVIINDQNKETIDLIIIVINFITALEESFFENQNLIPFLISIYFDFENTNEVQNKMLAIFSRILFSQIKFDPNFENFSPHFFEILQTFDDYNLKSKLIESFISSLNDIKTYSQTLVPFLYFFFIHERCSKIEIQIITKLIKEDSEIFQLLLSNDFINHILNSITKCKEQTNIDIINFYLFILQYDMTIRDQFNFDEICIEFFDSESEDEQICALNYFCHFFPECLDFLIDNIGIDLLWSIVSDGINDSTVELKFISILFLLKLLQFNKNEELKEMMLNSDLFEKCEIVLNLDEIESTLNCIEILFILLNIAIEDPDYLPVFLEQFSNSNIKFILTESPDEKVQILASDLIQKIDELVQN